MGLNEQKECLVQSTSPVEDRPALRTRQSKCEDAGFSKDRERLRPSNGQTRQSLGAVGRVASRVRTSGISKISTFLPRNKEEDDEVSASPWGVGTAAIAIRRSQSASVLLDVTKVGSLVEPDTSPKSKRNSDVIEMSSPISTDGGSTDQEKPDNPKIPADRARTPVNLGNRQASGGQTKSDKVVEHRGRPSAHINLLDRQASNAMVKSKFTFRPSASVDWSPRSGLDERGRGAFVSPSSARPPAIRQRSVEVRSRNEKAMSISSPVITFQETAASHSSTSRVRFDSDSSKLAEGSVSDPAQDAEKSRILKFTFGKGKGRSDEAKNRKMAGTEKPRGFMSIVRSKSQSGRASSLAGDFRDPNEQGPPLRSRKSIGLASRNGGNVPKPNSSFTKRKGSGWFAFLTGDHGSERRSKNVAESVDGPRSRWSPSHRRTSVGPDFFTRSGTRKQDAGVKAPRVDLLRRRDFHGVASDAKAFEHVRIMDTEEFGTLDRDEDSGDEAPIRSLAMDDFISYQTKKGRRK